MAPASLRRCWCCAECETASSIAKCLPCIRVYVHVYLHVPFDLTAYKYFAVANSLHPDVFPMVRKMEAECVQMVINLFHGSATAVGVLTSGGTESIIMAMKAYRYDHHRATCCCRSISIFVSVYAPQSFREVVYYDIVVVASLLSTVGPRSPL